MNKTFAVNEMPIQERYMLYIKEASVYFNIGIKKLRRMAENNDGNFALYLGNRFLICRLKFEEYLMELMKNPSDVTELMDEDD